MISQHSIDIPPNLLNTAIMADIFSMDDDEIPDLSGRINSFHVSDHELNYRLVEESQDALSEGPYSSDTLSELPTSIPIPALALARPTGRRNSTIASSYEVELIKKSYVAASLIADNSMASLYKPKLADFEPIKVLGKGSYGKVLLVREARTGKLFAQKQLKKASMIINENTNEIHETNYQRTLNEKNILQMVNHHNIVKLFYAFQDHNKVYLILEYLDGGELFHHLALERYMSETNASYYIAQIVLALRYLHCTLKVIYRDLKPENCMLNAGGQLVLTDFGLSKVSSDDGKDHSMTGTAQYMAPEVLKGEPYDYLVDWWSLGCVAFDLLTGAPPFTGNNNKKIMDKILASKKTLKFPFYLSLDAKDFLKKLLQANPEKRFNIDDDFEKLKKHRFFRHIDWHELELGNTGGKLPPILPLISDPVLAENFDKEFTDMVFTPQSCTLDKDILHVNGFSYINEHYLASIY